MRVANLMHTPAVVCRPDSTLRQVAHLMGERNVGSVVVIDNIGYLTGIVTDRDIALRGPGSGRSADVPVSAIMSRDVAAVSPQSDANEALAVMQKRGVRRVPVVDDMGRVHGVVSVDDVIRELTHEADTVYDAVFRHAV
jgi:CBS domain-containing protein